MRRLLVLGISLSALLWIAAVSATPVAKNVVSISADASSLAGNSSGSSDSEHQWRAQQHTIAAVTESVWKSAPVHAALASTPLPRSFDASRAASSPDPPADSAPHYLRHTPLLI